MSLLCFLAPFKFLSMYNWFLFVTGEESALTKHFIKLLSSPLGVEVIVQRDLSSEERLS